MEENTKTEQFQNLDEEQLQALTGAGGYEDVLQAAKQANHHLTIAISYGKIIDNALNRKNPKTEFATMVAGLRQGHKRAADDLMNTAESALNDMASSSKRPRLG